MWVWVTIPLAYRSAKGSSINPFSPWKLVPWVHPLTHFLREIYLISKDFYPLCNIPAYVPKKWG
jgi:hypothetical protein